MKQMAWKYTAFLSYSSNDKVEAIRLQRFLESYRVPKPLPGTSGKFGTLPKKIGKIFRDRTDAAGSPDLRKTIEEALAESRDLIVLCSLSAADSNSWVNKEIVYFRNIRSSGQILPIIASGDPPSCFPPSLKKQSGANDGSYNEPLAADMRSEGDGRKEAYIKLAAALLGVDFDKLRRREDVARRRKRRIIMAILAGYIATVTLGAVLIAKATVDLSRSRSKAIAEYAKDKNDSGLHDVAMLLAMAALPPREGAIISPVPEARTQLLRSLVQGRLRRVIQAQKGTIYSISRHPTKSWIFTGGAEGQARLINWETGDIQQDFKGHIDAVFGTDVSPDGTRFVTCGNDKSIRIWNIKSEKSERVISTKDWVPRSIKFSPEGERLVVAGTDGFARIFQIETGKEVTRSPPHEGIVLSASFSSSGKTVLSGSYNGRLIEWDADTGNLLVDHGVVGPINHIGYDKNINRWITTHAKSGGLHFWLPRKKSLPTILPTGANGGTFAYSPDGRFIVTAHWDKTARVIDLRTSKILATFQHSDWVDGAVFSHDSKLIITADHAGRIRVWDNPGLSVERAVLYHNIRGSGDLQISKNGRFLFSGGSDGTIISLNLNTSSDRILWINDSCRNNNKSNKDCGISRIDAGHNGNKLAIITQDNRAYLIAIADGSILWEIPDEELKSDCAFLSPDGIAISYKNGNIKLWSISERKILASTKLPNDDWAQAIASNTDRQQIAIAGTDGRLWVWSPDGKLIARKNWRHGRAVRSVAWSADGSLVVTGGADNTILIGNPDDSTSPKVIRAHNWVNSVNFSIDSRFILSAGSDGYVSIWDSNSGQLITQFDGGASEKPHLNCNAAVITPDNRFVYIHNSLGRVDRFTINVPSSDVRDAACSRLAAGRSAFTEEEMLEFTLLNEEDRYPCQRKGILSYLKY